MKERELLNAIKLGDVERAKALLSSHLSEQITIVPN